MHAVEQLIDQQVDRQHRCAIASLMSSHAVGHHEEFAVRHAVQSRLSFQIEAGRLHEHRFIQIGDQELILIAFPFLADISPTRTGDRGQHRMSFQAIHIEGVSPTLVTVYWILEWGIGKTNGASGSLLFDSCGSPRRSLLLELPEGVLKIMSTAVKRISVQEYLSREREAAFKSEYFAGEIFAMAGGSPKHSLIAANFIREAGNALKGKPCAVFSGDLRVRIQPTGLYTYPDASIVCGELEFDDERQDTVVNPTVIVEVLSDSTEKYDRGRKADHYRQVASLQELVLIAQDYSHVERFTRQADGSWLFQEVKELSASLQLPSLGVSLELAEIYRNVQFDATTL